MLEVTEGDLTDDGAAHMWELPKLKEVFKRKLSMLATKYGLVATQATTMKAAPAQNSTANAPQSVQTSLGRRRALARRHASDPTKSCAHETRHHHLLMRVCGWCPR